MSIQVLIVTILVLGAAGYVVRSVYRSTKGHSCESGACKCEPKIQKKV